MKNDIAEWFIKQHLKEVARSYEMQIAMQVALIEKLERILWESYQTHGQGD